MGKIMNTVIHGQKYEHCHTWANWPAFCIHFQFVFPEKHFYSLKHVLKGPCDKTSAFLHDPIQWRINASPCLSGLIVIYAHDIFWVKQPQICQQSLDLFYISVISKSDLSHAQFYDNHLISGVCVEHGTELSTNDDCLNCPIGYYRNASAHSNCVPCPRHWITPTKGSSDENDCSLCKIVLCIMITLPFIYRRYLLYIQSQGTVDIVNNCLWRVKNYLLVI